MEKFPGEDIPHEELTGHDYTKMPFSDLVNHPDFSSDALRNVVKVGLMTSAQLEKLTEFFKGEQ